MLRVSRFFAVLVINLLHQHSINDSTVNFLEARKSCSHLWSLHYHHYPAVKSDHWVTRSRAEQTWADTTMSHHFDTLKFGIATDEQARGPGQLNGDNLSTNEVSHTRDHPVLSCPSSHGNCHCSFWLLTLKKWLYWYVRVWENVKYFNYFKRYSQYYLYIIYNDEQNVCCVGT